MTSFSLRPSLAVLASLFSLSAIAQPVVQELDQVVVTAARAPQSAQQVVGDVTVITQEELARAGQNSVAEVLARQAGIEFYNNGGPQAATGVSIRGAEARHTLVLIDGMRVNSSVYGGANWNAIDTANIERIEIVRGAVSSLYGSDAIGGVVNIITKTGQSGQPAQLYGSIGYGSHGTFRSSLGLSGSHEGLSYHFAASMADSDGYNATNKDNADFYHGDKDGYSQHSFNGAIVYEWAAEQKIGFNAYNGYINGDFDAGEFSPGAFTQTRQQSYNLYSQNRLAANWLSTLNMGLSKEFIANPTYSNHLSTLQRQYRWQNDITLTADQHLSLIAERLEERITHNLAYTNTDRNTNSIAAIYRAQYNPHHIQISLRNDAISGFGHRVTGGIGYDLDLDANWTVGVAANTGFKAPSMSDLYYPLDWGFQGNPNLKPEKSRNMEAHLGYDNGVSQFKVTAFQNKVRDLIDPYVCDSNFQCTALNVDRATIRGVSLFGAHDFGNLNLWASADFTNPRDDSTRNQLTRRAKQNVKAGANYQWQALNVGAEYQYVGKRYDDQANNNALGGYSLVNLTAEYAVNQNVTAQIRWNNVFDKTYHNAYGYNMPGSNVFLNLAWRM